MEDSALPSQLGTSQTYIIRAATDRPSAGYLGESKDDLELLP